MTPLNSVGKCVPSRFCVSVMTALINQDHLTNSNVAQFLRRLQCGNTRGSHKVCCEINDIDFGSTVDQSTPKIVTNLQPPRHDSSIGKRLSDYDKCGKLNNDETPLKWIGELWFEERSSTKTHLELKCLGTLISHKHLIVPAHCVAYLPANITL